MFVPFLSYKFVSGKTDESTSYMMSKAVFVEKVDDDDIDFELAFYGRIHRASRLFAEDNQISKSIISCNITGLLGEQRLLGTELLRKK